MAKTSHIELDGSRIALVGTVQGFVPDGEAVKRELERLEPIVVGLGVPPEDLEGLRLLAESESPEHLIAKPPPAVTGAAAPAAGAPGVEAILGGGRRNVPTGAEDDAPFQSLDVVQQHFLDLLARFGNVGLPSADLGVAHGWARDHEARVEALDLDDESHAEVYIRANRFRDVLRSGRIQRKLLKQTFEDAADSDELAIQWDAFQNAIPSLQKVEAAREKEMARRIGELASDAQRLVAVVPVARMEGILASLDDEETAAD